jgi:hypothetical protein
VVVRDSLADQRVDALVPAFCPRTEQAPAQLPPKLDSP